jgi:hypothetical protein
VTYDCIKEEVKLPALLVVLHLFLQRLRIASGRSTAILVVDNRGVVLVIRVRVLLILLSYLCGYN